ncbi:MAG: hypothetical protein AAFQ07_02505 [Chloroflexota bacterium]
MAQKVKRKGTPQNFNIFGVIFKLIGSLFGGLGWLLGQVANGIGWAIRNVFSGIWWLIQNSVGGIVWVLTTPYRMLRYLLNGHIPHFETEREKAIFWRVKRRFRRKRLFMLHSTLFGIFTIFASMNIINQTILMLTEGAQYPWSWGNYVNNTTVLIAFVLGWTFALWMHNRFNSMGNTEDQAVNDALEAEYRRQDHMHHYEHLEDEVYYDDEAYYDDAYLDEKQKRYQD